jgi:excisionase family DNA binding protein
MMNPEALESFVDADEAAKFLSLTRRRVLDLARAGQLPAHPIGDGARRVWRFRLSEIASAVASNGVYFSGKPRYTNEAHNELACGHAESRR